MLFLGRLHFLLTNQKKVRLLIILGGFHISSLINAAYAADCGQPGAPACVSDILKVLENAIRLLTPAAAIAFFIMVIVGGFKFLTSGGDQKSVASARSTMQYAIFGVILLVVSWLVLLLIKSITGIDVTEVSF